MPTPDGELTPVWPGPQRDQGARTAHLHDPTLPPFYAAYRAEPTHSHRRDAFAVVPCRLHAVLCGLVPGGASKEITAAHATRILEQVTPPGAVARARCELAAECPADLRRLDTQLRESKKKLALVVLCRSKIRFGPVTCGFS